MAWQGKMSLAEALKGDPHHPFARPGIMFIPRRPKSSPPTKTGSPATAPGQYCPWSEDPDPPQPRLTPEQLEKFSQGVGKLMGLKPRPKLQATKKGRKSPAS